MDTYHLLAHYFQIVRGRTHTFREIKNIQNNASESQVKLGMEKCHRTNPSFPFFEVVVACSWQ